MCQYSQAGVFSFLEWGGAEFSLRSHSNVYRWHRNKTIEQGKSFLYVLLYAKESLYCNIDYKTVQKIVFLQKYVKH